MIDIDHIYRAKVRRVVDGDTVDLEVDQGFYVTSALRFRLAGIDSPEIRGENKEAGRLAKEALATLLWVGREIYVQSTKGDSFGRWLGVIYLPCGTNVNERLIQIGHAKPYKG